MEIKNPVCAVERTNWWQNMVNSEYHLPGVRDFIIKTKAKYDPPHFANALRNFARPISLDYQLWIDVRIFLFYVYVAV